MLKKTLFLIVIFSGCTSSELLNQVIEAESARLVSDVISGKSKKQKKKLERDKILNLECISEPKRNVGEKWIDSNGKRWVQRDGFKMEVSEPKLQQYTGWWVYGEGQHIFKDEQTLEEYDMEFPNENMGELVELYLAVCEMEYFPMECMMQGNLQNDTLIVADFEILYIQGCGE
jgi:hypothetical protein